MKKSQAYVTRGEPAARERPGPDSEWEAPPRVPHPSALNPADLPRDRGMAGPVGAYEVPPLAKSVPAGLEALAGHLRGADPLEAVNAALDALLPPGERHRLAAESCVGGLLTLSLARREDRFAYGRFLVPKLRAALTPELGNLTIRLIDR